MQEEVYAYISERLRRYFLDRDSSLDTETFDAVLVRQPASLVDFQRRLDAVQSFLGHESASSLAAAKQANRKYSQEGRRARRWRG